MNQHVRLVHLNTNVCDMCGKTVKGKAALQRHIEEHQGITRAPIPCHLCGFALANKYALTRHIKVMHTEEQRTPTTCPVCSKVSPSVYASKRHMEYMHSMKRKHQCPMCDKAFKRATEWRVSFAQHSEEQSKVYIF